MFNDFYSHYDSFPYTEPANVDFSALTLAGSDTVDACYAVSDFAQMAVAIAVSEVQSLLHVVWNKESPATVSRLLTNAWCRHSVRPVDWELPATWDEFAGDYPTRDGWIRLHTNAPHHRLAALQVLDNPGDRLSTNARVAEWAGEDLESAVVQAGGAAAVMQSQADWNVSKPGLAVNQEPVVAWQIQEEKQTLRYTLDSNDRPLSGVKVLDLTRVLAGPVCTRFLASLGAEVLRIDPPHWNEDGNAIEMTVGKRCAGLDFHQQPDFNQFVELLSQANVLVHGYRANALAGLNLSEAERDCINPTLVDVALNAYGWTGPWRNRRGFDSLVQMSSGIAEKG